MLMAVLAALGLAILGLFAAVVKWFANIAIETRDTIRAVAATLYDETTGLVRTVYRNHSETQGAMGELSNENVEFDKRLTRVEDRCGMNHGPHNGAG